ncbi:hypothetical protein G9A89_006499 [Geosiphon pyriformis]|nr:hypothetical protein G9A89_006499 [Geosiphon pyriformis]
MILFAKFLNRNTDNNISITLRNRFYNIKQEPSESVMTYIGKFNKLLRQICQLETNNYYSNAQILDQFIASLKDKLIKKVCPHAPEDLNSVIQHAKRYEMAMEEANCTKLVNLAIGETSSAAEEKLTNSQKKLKTISPTNNNSNPKDINHSKDGIKTTSHHPLITSLRVAITVEFLATGKEIAESYNKTNKIGVINITLYHSNLIINYHHQLTIHQDPNIKVTIITIPTTTHTTLSGVCSKINPAKSIYTTKLISILQNPAQSRPTHYHTQPSYLTIPEEQNFHHTVLSEGRAAARQQNSSYTPTTILPARIAENANLSDIFSFKFEANESPFLLSNVATNKQKAITVMYTEAEVEGKPICLILDSGSAGSIITYQLMQQLKRNVDRLAKTVIVTADGIKKTPVGEIDNFPFTLDRIIISVKILVMNTPQYQALIRNNWLQKANANLNWETQELTISYQGQHTQVSVTCDTFNKCSEKAPAFEFELEEEKPIIETFMALGSTSNWADETEQQYFSTNDSLETKEPVTTRWNVSYSKPEPQKQCPYIPLKCKNCHKKLSSMGACILPEEEYENHTCHLIKRSGKWDNTPCLTCGDMLSEECNWIDVAMRGRVCDQTCQYALSISEKVKRRTPFNAAYNSALNKLYHYPHDAKIIFDLTMTLINRATKKNVCQMKEAEYIEYTIKLTRFDYKDEVKVYHQIAKQINIRLCEECIMSCDEQWCLECYALSIPLPSKNDENEIEFEEPEATKEIKATPIYLIENQSALQLKYFNNNGQGIKPKKAHEIDAEYNLRYPDKDTLVLKPKSLTKINLKIALEISPRVIVQIASRSSLASKEINVREGIINAGYTGDITVILQNKTDKPFKIKHTEKIAQAIYLLLINISGLQLVNQRELLGKKIEVIHSNIFQQELPQTIPDFSEIIGHLLPKINPNTSSENYHVVIEKLSRINMGQLEPQQQNQLKWLIVEFADIFAKNNNDLRRTDLVQHQIYTGDVKPRRQQAYQIASESHQFI